MFEKIPNQKMVITALFLALCMVVLTLVGLQTTAAYAGPPSGTDTPTDPPPPVPATLIGLIALQERETGNLIIPVTVSLSPTDNINPEYSFELLTDVNGVFTLTNIEPGDYDIRIKGINTLRNLAQGVTLVSGDNYYFFGELKSGDVETDQTFNQIGVLDLITFNTYLSNFFEEGVKEELCAGEIGFDPLFDLNANGCVALNDFGILLGHIPELVALNGDIIEDAIPIENLSLPESLQAQGADVLLGFNPDKLEVGVAQVVTTPLEVNACCNMMVNIVQFNLSFSPTLININDIITTTQLPFLFSKTIDNEKGEASYIAFRPGYFTNTITAALLSLKATTDTNGTVITPTTFKVFGPEDLSLATTEAQSLTVKTQNKGVCGAGYCYHFPIIFKN